MQLVVMFILLEISASPDPFWKKNACSNRRELWTVPTFCSNYGVYSKNMPDTALEPIT